MKIKIIIPCVLFFWGSLLANNISGDVGFQMDEQPTIKNLSVIIGDPDHGRKYGFPDYLSGLSSRYTENGDAIITSDGKFNFDKITLDQDKIVILKSPKASYFKRIQILKGVPYVWNEVIKLPSENLKTVKIKVINNVTKDLPITYFIEAGNEGWAFSGKNNRETSIVTISDVPNGIYNFVTLTSVGNDKPNRVDSFRIEVSDNMADEIIVEIDGEIGNTIRKDSTKSTSAPNEKPTIKNQGASVDNKFQNGLEKQKVSEEVEEEQTSFPWWIIGLLVLLAIVFLLLQSKSKR